MLGIINRFLSFVAVIIIPKFAAKFNSKFYSKNYSGIMRFVTNISCYSNFVICQQDRLCLRLPCNKCVTFVTNQKQPKYSYVKFFTTFVKKRPLVQNSMLIFFKRCIFIYWKKALYPKRLKKIRNRTAQVHPSLLYWQGSRTSSPDFKEEKLCTHSAPVKKS